MESWIPEEDLSCWFESHWGNQFFSHQSWTCHYQLCGWILHKRYFVLVRLSVWLGPLDEHMRSRILIVMHQLHKWAHHSFRFGSSNHFLKHSYQENQLRWIGCFHCLPLVSFQLKRWAEERKSHVVTSSGIQPLK